jgi:hypothetical protein
MAFQSFSHCHRRYCVACLGNSTLDAAVDTHDSLGMSSKPAASCSQGTALGQSRRLAGHSYTLLPLPLSHHHSLNLGLGLSNHAGPLPSHKDSQGSDLRPKSLRSNARLISSPQPLPPGAVVPWGRQCRLGLLKQDMQFLHFPSAGL